MLTGLATIKLVRLSSSTKKLAKIIKVPKGLIKGTISKRLTITSTEMFAIIIPALSKVSNMGFPKAKIVPTKQLTTRLSVNFKFIILSGPDFATTLNFFLNLLLFYRMNISINIKLNIQGGIVTIIVINADTFFNLWFCN